MFIKTSPKNKNIIIDTKAVTEKNNTVKNFELNVDKGYAKVSSECITIKALKNDRYEYIRQYQLGFAEGEYFCNQVDAVVSKENSNPVTFGYELGDVVTIEGNQFKLVETHNNNISLEKV